MKEQNLDSPIYTENDHSVTLILKNNIEERNIKHQNNNVTQGLTQGLTQATQDFTQANNDRSVEERILSVIKEKPEVTQSKIAKETGIPVDSVKYYIRKMRENHIIAREGTSQKGKWIIL